MKQTADHHPMLDVFACTQDVGLSAALFGWQDRSGAALAPGSGVKPLPMYIDGTTTMSKGVGKTRLAIAVFDGGDRLWLAMTELFRRGFVRHQMGIIALATALTSFGRPSLSNDADNLAVTSILDDVDRTTTRTDQVTVAVTRNSVWQFVGLLRFEAADGLIMADWMTPQLRNDLTSYIRNGAVVLGVSSNTLDQQRQSTRVLLEHSSHRVQTHEFTL